MVTLLVTLKNLKGIGFIVLTIGMRIVEIGHAGFIEDGDISGSDKPRNVVIQEVRVFIPVPLASREIVVPLV
ncbi:hypothetical protein KJJ93_28335, partial [Escherichia coli]|uniref:hypothetical protein n=1 Tax=Escherichia coli TaxID=562 RepID=UPI001BD9C176